MYIIAQYDQNGYFMGYLCGSKKHNTFQKDYYQLKIFQTTEQCQEKIKSFDNNFVYFVRDYTKDFEDNISNEEHNFIEETFLKRKEIEEKKKIYEEKQKMKSSLEESINNAIVRESYSDYYIDIDMLKLTKEQIDYLLKNNV